MKNRLPESKRRNVATLIMMGRERERAHEREWDGRNRSPLSLLLPHQWEVRGGGEEKFQQNFCISFFFVIFFTYVNALFFFSLSSSHLFLSPSPLFNQHLYYFISLLSFVNLIFTSIQTLNDTSGAYFISFVGRSVNTATRLGAGHPGILGSVPSSDWTFFSTAWRTNLVSI